MAIKKKDIISKEEARAKYEQELKAEQYAKVRDGLLVLFIFMIIALGIFCAKHLHPIPTHGGLC